MKERNAILLMLLASFIWGITFVFQSQAADVIGPMMYNAIRFLIGFVVLQPFVIPALRKHKGDRSYFRSLLKGALLCGFFLATASVAQQAGMAYTTASKAGFLTSLYTLMVPVFSVVMGKKVSARIWLCVLIGVLGAFLLSMGTDSTSIGKGDLLMLLCAMLFALQIMAIDRVGKDLEGIVLSAFQFLTAGLMCLAVGIFAEDFAFQMVRMALVPILYAGVCSCGIAYTLQVVGQKYVQPAKATLALSLENAWAAVGGVLLLHEVLSVKEVTGCALLFFAVILAQLLDR